MPLGVETVGRSAVADAHRVEAARGRDFRVVAAGRRDDEDQRYPEPPCYPHAARLAHRFSVCHPTRGRESSARRRDRHNFCRDGTCGEQWRRRPAERGVHRPPKHLVRGHTFSMILRMRRARVTVTLSPDVLSKVDRAARAKPGSSRSSVIEAWLRKAAAGEAHDALDRAIARYYDDLSAVERAEGEAWASFSTRSFMVREGRSRSPYRSTRATNRKRK